MTGGLQEQVTDGENWFGIGLEPTSKAIIGSQTVPYIYEDRLSQEVVVNALIGTVSDVEGYNDPLTIRTFDTLPLNQFPLPPITNLSPKSFWAE